LSAEPCNRLRRVRRARFDQRSECTTIAKKGTHLFGRLLLGVYLRSHRCACWPSSFSCFSFGRALCSPACGAKQGRADAAIAPLTGAPQTMKDRRWKPASPLAGLPSGLGLLAAAGPPLLLFK
jgi:hypothetical protein